MAALANVFLSLGSNVEPRESYMQNALAELKDSQYLNVLGESGLLDNPALIDTRQGPFLNQIVFAECTLSPPDLLAWLLETEVRVGRIFRYKNGPREIDLDILSYDSVHGSFQSSTQELQLPHPGLYDRPYLHELLNQLGAYFQTGPNPGIYFKKKNIV